MDEIVELWKAVKELGQRVQTAQQMIQLQRAEIEALLYFATARISDLSGDNRENTLAHVRKTAKAIYDETILRLEEKNPELATYLDIRPLVPEKDQASWYLAGEDFPKPNESEDDNPKGE